MHFCERVDSNRDVPLSQTGMTTAMSMFYLRVRVLVPPGPLGGSRLTFWKRQNRRVDHSHRPTVRLSLTALDPLQTLDLPSNDPAPERRWQEQTLPTANPLCASRRTPCFAKPGCPRARCRTKPRLFHVRTRKSSLGSCVVNISWS